MNPGPAFDDLVYPDFRPLLDAIGRHLNWHVSHEGLRPDSPDTKVLAQRLRDHCVKPNGEGALRKRLGDAKGLIALCGRGGCGKTTFLVKFLSELQGTLVGPQRKGYILLDFDRDDGLGFNPLDPPAGLDLMPLLRKAVLEQIQAKYFSTGASRRLFDTWLRTQFAQQRQIGQTGPLARLFVNIRPEVEVLMRRKTGMDPFDDDAFGAFVKDHDRSDPELADLLLRKVYPDITVEQYIDYLLEAAGFAAFFFVFDNVDGCRHELQKRYFGILDALIEKTRYKAVGVISIRTENTHDVAPYRNMASDPLKRFVLTDPTTNEDHPIELPFVELDLGGQTAEPDDDEDGAVPKHPVPQEGLKKRIRHAAASLGTLTERQARSLELLRRMAEHTLDNYIEGQLFRLCNESMRLFNKTFLDFLDYAVRHHLALIQQAVRTNAPLTPLMGNIFYVFLNDETPSRPFVGIDYAKKMASASDPQGCFVEHLILAYLLNLRLHMRDEDRVFCFTTVAEIRRAITDAGFNGEYVTSALGALRGAGNRGDHLVEIREAAFDGVEHRLGSSDSDQVWITPRGEETVVNLPYRFFFVHKSLSDLVGSRDVWTGTVEKRAELVISFIRELINYNIPGLVRIQQAYRRRGVANWESVYLEVFGIPPQDLGIPVGGMRNTYQVNRFIANAKQFLFDNKVGKDHPLQMALDTLRRSFDGIRDDIRHGRQPKPLPRDVPFRSAGKDFGDFLLIRKALGPAL